MQHLFSRAFAIALVFAGLSSLAFAQCNYSLSDSYDVYPSSDGSTIYASTTIYDYSGCNHSQYSTTATITSPSGRQASSTMSGMSAEMGIAFNNEEGDYAGTESNTFWCPAANRYASFGFNFSVNIHISHSYWTNGYSGPLGTRYWASQNCYGGTSSSCADLGGVVFANGCPPQVYATAIVITETTSTGTVSHCSPAFIYAALGGGYCD